MVSDPLQFEKSSQILIDSGRFAKIKSNMDENKKIYFWYKFDESSSLNTVFVNFTKPGFKHGIGVIR